MSSFTHNSTNDSSFVGCSAILRLIKLTFINLSFVLVELPVKDTLKRNIKNIRNIHTSGQNPIRELTSSVDIPIIPDIPKEKNQFSNLITCPIIE